MELQVASKFRKTFYLVKHYKITLFEQVRTSQKSTRQKHIENIKTIFFRKGSKCKRMTTLEQISLLAICLCMFATPGFWVRHFGGLKGRRKRKASVEIYALLKGCAAVLVLYFGLWHYPNVLIVGKLLLWDLFVNLSGYVFMRNFWQNPYSWNRSLLLIGTNFIEYSCWFASLYLAKNLLQKDCVTIHSKIDALYFSLVTGATVGYGDITPYPGEGRTLVSIHICLSLFFMATVVTYFVSNLSTREKDKDKNRS